MTSPRQPSGATRLRDRLEGPQGPDSDEYVGPRDLTSWDTRLGRRVAGLAGWAWQRAEGVWGWATPRWAILLTVALGLLVAGLMAGGTAELYEGVVEGDGMSGLDRPVLEAAVDARSPAVNTAVTAFTDLGGKVGMPVLATAVAVGLALLWRSWTPVVLVAVTGAGSLLMTAVGKSAVGRARPPLDEAVPPFESSFSFPSGHSLNAMAIAGIVAYLLVRKLRHRWARALAVTGCLVFAVAMGLSRVYLGHHWLTDVVTAWALALGWLALVVTGHRLWLTVRRRRPAHPVRADA
jgi:undecaprenyl-diphosphatase